MNDDRPSGMTRRGLLRAFAATALTAAPYYANAAGFVRGGGDIRRFKMRVQRSGEMIDIVYWIQGEYIQPALQEISHLMRDVRTNSAVPYAPQNIDILTAVHRLLETSEPYLLLSGYRSAQTNAALASRSRSVASNSYHTRAMAADVRLSSRGISQIAAAAEACNAGGVGRYGGSNFVHMDCGPVRTWRG